MATLFDALAKNAMLQGLKDWNPSSVGTTFIFGAYSTDASVSMVASANGTYGTPASGAMDITGNVTINVTAGNTVAHMRIQKGTYPNDNTIYKKDVTSMTFTYAGTITVTSAEISLVDPS